MAVPSLNQLNTTRGSSFAIPPFDKITFTYVADGASDDDDIETQVFSYNGVTVATLTYTYVGSTNNAATITMTVP